MSSRPPDIADKLADDQITEWQRGLLRTLAAADRPLHFEEVIAAHGDSEAGTAQHEIGLQYLREKGLAVEDGADTGENPTWRVNRTPLSSHNFFPHRPVLGREADLQDLRERVSKPGFTFLTGPASIGKSTLVRETAGQLADPATAAAHGHDRPWLVGYAESSGSSNGLLMEATRNLYQQWLDQASLIEEISSTVERYCDQHGSSTARTVRDILLGAGSVASTVAEKGSFALVNTIFGKLRGTNQEIQSGGLNIDPIDYESIRDLLKVLEGISGRPMLLALDAWEQGTTDADRSALRKMAGRTEEWPEQFHVMAIIRDSPSNAELLDFATQMEREKTFASLRYVDPLDLSDRPSIDGVLNFLYDQVPSTQSGSPDWIRGNAVYPAVIDAWIREQPANLAELSETAQQGQKATHQGVIQRLEELNSSDPEAFETAVRLALLPEITSDQTADELTPVACGDDHRAAKRTLARLKSLGVLDHANQQHPRFSHTTVYEAIGSWLVDGEDNRHRNRYLPYIQMIANEIVDDIGSRARAAGDGDIFGENAEKGLLHRPEAEAVLASIHKRFAGTLLDEKHEKLTALASAAQGDVSAVSQYSLNELAAAAYDASDEFPASVLADGLSAGCGACADATIRDHSGYQAAMDSINGMHSDNSAVHFDELRFVQGLKWSVEHFAEAGDFGMAAERLTDMIETIDQHPQTVLIRKYAEAASQAIQHEAGSAEPHVLRPSGHLEELRSIAHREPGDPAVVDELLAALATRAHKCNDREATEMLLEDAVHTTQPIPDFEGGIEKTTTVAQTLTQDGTSVADIVLEIGLARQEHETTPDHSGVRYEYARGEFDRESARPGAP